MGGECGPLEGVRFEAYHLLHVSRLVGEESLVSVYLLEAFTLAFIKLNVKAGSLCVENGYQILLKEDLKVTGLGTEGNGSLCSLTLVTEVSFSGK